MLKLILGSSLFFLCFVSGVYGAHIHFEEFYLKDVSFNQSNNSHEWIFDLDQDLLYLWNLDDTQVQNQSQDFVTIDPNEDENHFTLLPNWFEGTMLPENNLHHAYLTMRFTSQSSCCGGGGCSTQAQASLYLDTSSYWSGTVTPGNTFNPIDVYTYMENDHKLIVKLILDSCSSGCSGGCGCGGGCNCCDCGFTVDWVKLSGCFDCTTCDPIPEPSTLILAGLGLLVLSRIKRGRLF